MDFDKVKFRKLRERRGMTQEELAGFLGVSKSAVSYWENPKRSEKPLPRRQKALLEILHCSAEELEGTGSAAAEFRQKIRAVLSDPALDDGTMIRRIRCLVDPEK